MYYDGTVLKRDYKKAAEVYRKGAMLGDNWCKNRLAEMYRDGRGLNIDIDKAFYWFTL